MTMSKLPDVLGALIADGLGAIAVPGASSAGEAVKGYLQRRSDEARAILLDEFRCGNIDAANVAAEDDRVAVVYRYLRASWEGSARVNRRLLAKAIVGRIRTNTLVADEFLPHADALATLSRDEIILLATMYLIRGTIGLETDKLKFSSWAATLAQLQERCWQTDRAEATAGRALRSGYVIAGWRTSEMVYRLSPLLIDLCKTVDFDDALRRETQDAASEQPPAD
jgi:hypothetical protein